MSNARSRIVNLALAAGSLALVLLASLAADRIYGVVAPPVALPNTMELIFPPNARQSFKSIEFAYEAHINRLGLRERDLAPKRPGVFRICALGDSYTYGWGVNAEQTWLRLLEEKLKAEGLEVETINLGKPGSGPDFYSDLARRALPLLEPDLVIVGILMGNDIIATAPTGVEADKLGVTLAESLYPNIVRALRRPAVPEGERTTEVPPQVSTAEDNVNWTRNTAQSFLEKMSAEERARYGQIDERVRTAFEAGLFNPYMVDLALKSPETYQHTLRLDDPWIEQCIQAVSDHLRIIAEAASSVDAPTVVAVLPDGPYVNDHALQGIQRVGYKMPPDAVDSDGPDQAVRETASRAGLPVISATAAFKARRGEPGFYFELDGHMTPKGHALFAEAIAPEVARLVREAGGGAQP